MRNYAEALAYWYLRLNGFFPIADFVLHHKGGDTDILAVRPPFTCEYTGGERLKEDQLLIKIINETGCDFFKFFVGIIGEAKGGKSKNPISRNTLNEKFDLESLKHNLRRLGLFKNSQIDSVASNLKHKKAIVSEFVSVHKILFAHAERFSPKENDDFSFISLEATREFIEERMNLDFKTKDWDKFDANMIQDIILRNR